MFFKKSTTFLSFSEWVSVAHPDRLADLLAAIVINDIQKKDGVSSHAAIEVMLTHDSVIFGGEARTTLDINHYYLTNVVRKAFTRAGYIPEMAKYWTKEQVLLPPYVSVYNKIEAQSPDIALGTTDKEAESGYNDQGVFFSSSENTNDFKMGYPHLLAKLISDNLFNYSKASILNDSEVKLGPDNKVVVTCEVEADGMTPINVSSVVVAVPTTEDAPVSTDTVITTRVKKVIADAGIPLSKNFKLTINGTGKFVIHGAISDTSLTGRKISVNHPSAGPLWSNKMIGGGSMIKPLHASDLVLNLTARFIANIIVQAGLSKYALVGISCGIGKTTPEAIFIKGDSKFKKHKVVERFFLDNFDWRPCLLARMLGFFDENFDFSKVVEHNFFGDPESQYWEVIDHQMVYVERLLAYLNK